MSSFRLLHLGYLIQQIHRLGRVRNPRRRTRQPCFEIVRARRQELVPDVQRFAALDPAKVLLAGHDAPGFVADVDEDVVAACCEYAVSQSCIGVDGIRIGGI
jgi:hypothetical protein